MINKQKANGEIIMIEKRFKVTKGFGNDNEHIITITDTITTEIYSMDTEFEAKSVCEKWNNLVNENKQLIRHIERNTINRLRVEDVLSCARDSRFYENEEIVKAIDCIAKDLGIDLE